MIASTRSRSSYFELQICGAHAQKLKVSPLVVDIALASSLSSFFASYLSIFLAYGIVLLCEDEEPRYLDTRRGLDRYKFISRDYSSGRMYNT